MLHDSGQSAVTVIGRVLPLDLLLNTGQNDNVATITDFCQWRQWETASNSHFRPTAAIRACLLFNNQLITFQQNSKGQFNNCGNVDYMESSSL